MRFDKNIRVIVSLCIFLNAGLSTHAQSNMDQALLKNMRGTAASFSSIVQKDSLILICFWSTNSDISITELNAINNDYEKWKKRVSFRLLAVCIDQGKEASRVKGISNMNDWKFDVFIDYSGDFQKAADVNNLPYCMILKSGKRLYQLAGYDPGSEKYLIEKLRSIAIGRQ